MRTSQPLVIGLNIKNASVDTLESLSIHHSDNRSRLHELTALTDLKGAVILSTCNRLELYGVSCNPEHSIGAMRTFLEAQDNASNPSHYRRQVTTAPQQFFYDFSGDAAVRHLYRVVSGLDSMVLGETEIMGQVARAYEHALSAGTTGKVLNVWFQRALSVGKKVRTDIKMDRYHTSVGRIAVDMAEQELGNLADKKILILGAGEMSELAVKHLVSKKASLLMVSNRSWEKAQALAAKHGFEASSMDELPNNLVWADLVFSATSAKHHLVSYSLLKDAHAKRMGRPLVFIDMAVPRDIDPRATECAHVRCFDITQLRDVSQQNLAQRRQAALLVETYIEEKVEEFSHWLDCSEAISMNHAFKQQYDHLTGDTFASSLSSTVC